MNNVQILGNLTRAPELRYTPQGKAVCNISIAINEGYGEKKKTHYFVAVAWEKTAEIISQHFTKGRKILIEGSLQQETWEKDGQKHSTVKIRISRVHFCEPKPQVDVSREAEPVVIPEEDIFPNE